MTMRRFVEVHLVRFAVSLGSLGLVIIGPGFGLGVGRAIAATLPSDKLPEPAITEQAQGADGEYLRKLHAQVHRRWTDNFLRLIGENLELSNPLNEAGRTADAELAISTDGQLVSSKIAKSSGFPGFDDAILEVLRDSVPFPRPPQTLRSDDDRLHLRWTFARDQRRCAGLTVL